jgi:hypothetical protein
MEETEWSPRRACRRATPGARARTHTGHVSALYGQDFGPKLKAPAAQPISLKWHLPCARAPSRNCTPELVACGAKPTRAAFALGTDVRRLQPSHACMDLCSVNRDSSSECRPPHTSGRSIAYELYELALNARQPHPPSPVPPILMPCPAGEATWRPHDPWRTCQVKSKRVLSRSGLVFLACACEN